MRDQPTLRIPLGILALVGALLAYAVTVATWVPPLVGDWPALAQTVIYLILGLVWLLPLRRFLIWMETGRWR
jgi:hypothetical protein